MLATLTNLLIAVIPLQLFLIGVGRVLPSADPIVVAFGSCIIAMQLLTQRLLFKVPADTAWYHRSVGPVTRDVAWLLAVAFLVGVVLVIGFLRSLDASRTLNALQGINDLGLAYKLVNIILPALAFCIFFSVLPTSIRWLFLLTGIGISTWGSIAFLSKAPIVSYAIFLLFLLQERKLQVKVVMTLGVALFFGMSVIYSLRDSTGDSLQDTLMHIVLRLPMIVETVQIVEWLQRNEPLWVFNMMEVPHAITSRVFGFDPYIIGIAPSFVGFFLVGYGFWGAPLGLLSIVVVAKMMNWLAKPGPLMSFRVFLYFVWALELASFFIDGIPWFYTSTRDGRMFWALVAATLGLLILTTAASQTKTATHDLVTVRRPAG